MLLAHVILNVGGEDVARHVDRLRADDAAQRDAGDLRRTAADIDHHVALGSLDVQTGTQSGRHRLVDHVDLAAAGVLGRVAHGADLHVEAARGLDLLDHAAQHELRSVEIGDHAVLERTDGLDVGVRLFVHAPRLVTDSHQTARMDVQRHDRRFVDHHLAVIDNQRIGRTEVNRQLLCQRKKSHKYVSYRFRSSQSIDSQHPAKTASGHCPPQAGAGPGNTHKGRKKMDTICKFSGFFI